MSRERETPRWPKIRCVSDNSSYEFKPKMDQWLSPKICFHWQSSIQITNSTSCDHEIFTINTSFAIFFKIIPTAYIETLLKFIFCICKVSCKLIWSKKYLRNILFGTKSNTLKLAKCTPESRILFGFFLWKT